MMRSQNDLTLLKKLTLYRLSYDSNKVKARKVFLVIWLSRCKREVSLVFTLYKDNSERAVLEEIAITNNQLCGLEIGTTVVTGQKGPLKSTTLEDHTYLSVIKKDKTFMFSAVTQEKNIIDVLFSLIKKHLDFVDHWGNLKVLPSKTTLASLHLTRSSLSLITGSPAQCVRQWALVEKPFPVSVSQENPRYLRLQMIPEAWYIETTRAREIVKTIHTIAEVITAKSKEKCVKFPHDPPPNKTRSNHDLKAAHEKFSSCKIVPERVKIYKRLSRSLDILHEKPLKSDDKIYANEDVLLKRSVSECQNKWASTVPPRCCSSNRKLSEPVIRHRIASQISDYWSEDITFTIINLLNNKKATPDTLGLTWKERCKLAVHMCVVGVISKGWKDFADQIGMTFEDVQVVEAFTRDHCLHLTCLDVVFQHWQYAYNCGRAARPCTREEVANILRRIGRPDLLDIIVRPPDLLNIKKGRKFSDNNSAIFY